MSSATKSAQPTDLRFFQGFAWPVPTAFSGAVAAFRFEPGDVLYRDVSGYAKPRRKPKKGSRAIQVLERPAGARTAGAAAETPEGDPRRANWESRVRITVLDLAAGTSTLRELTQGELFTALWRGDDTRLEGQVSEAPAMPHAARGLGQSLEAARDALVAGSSRTAKSEKGSRFLFVVDQSSDASRAKALTIEEGLLAAGPVDRVDLTPLEAGVEDAENYHPALLIRCLTMIGQEQEAVTAILRSRLYGGGSKADSGDRFSVARHGLLEALDAEASV